MYIFNETDLKGAYVIDNFSVGDNRGRFTKCYVKEVYEEAGINFNLSETFLSSSAKNVIRGIHFQRNNPQAKLVSVPKGKVYDVIVDLRVDSPTFKQWRGFELSEENARALYIPKGFGHGFLSLEDNTLMLYQCDGKYDKETDSGIRYDDKDIGITWPISREDEIHSERDLSLESLKEYMLCPMRTY